MSNREADTPMNARAIPQARSRFDLSTILTILGLVLTAAQSAIILIFFLSSKITTVDNIGSDMATFKQDVARRFDVIQLAQNEQFKILRSDIANIPEFQATLKLVNQRLDRDEVAIDVMRARVDDYAAKGVQNSADIVGILRTAGAAQRIQR